MYRWCEDGDEQAEGVVFLVNPTTTKINANIFTAVKNAFRVPNFAPALA